MSSGPKVFLLVPAGLRFLAAASNTWAPSQVYSLCVMNPSVFPAHTGFVFPETHTVV